MAPFHWIVPAAATLAVLSCGCEPAAPADAVQRSLIDHAAWQEVATEDDPLNEHRPQTVTCPGAAWGIEDATLEIDTGLCNYLSLSQPSLGEVSSGELISLVAWHAQLWDAETAEAHIAVLFDNTIAWQTIVPIPSDPGVFDLEFTAPVDLAVDAPIQLHLHNHGSNTWNFLELSQTL